MPTLTEVENVVSDLFRVVNEFDKYANANSEKFTNGATSHEADFLSSLTPADGVPFNTQSLMVSALENFRGSLNSQYSVSRELITTGLRTWADHASIPETSPEAILDRLFTYFTENSYTVQSRAMTLGTPAAGSNDGTGVINRLKVDENGMQIESGHTDAKRADCVSDQSSGTDKHEEMFEVRGADKLRDNLVVSGSGLTKNIRALSARNSLNYIQNPSFERFTGTTAVPTAITGWSGYDAGMLGQLALSTTTYRDYPGAPSTHYSLQFTSATGEQDLEINQDLKERNISITPGIPLYVQVAVYKTGTGGSGTVEFDIGGSTASSVNISALTNNAWTVVRMATGTTPGGDVDNWYKTMRDNVNLKIDITVASADVGRVLLFDDVIVSPFTEFDGGWYTIVGGSSKFSVDDTFTWSDTATESIIQKWIARLFPGHYLPHAASTPTWPEPT